VTETDKGDSMVALSRGTLQAGTSFRMEFLLGGNPLRSQLHELPSASPSVLSHG